MGHYVQIIIAPEPIAQSIAESWPELPRYRHLTGVSLFPVDAVGIDKRIPLSQPLTNSTEEFVLLTDSFRLFLRSLSKGGQLAYIETDYFGGVGGQGAFVCRDGIEVIAPTWESNAINRALKEIGVRRGLLTDRFASIGLGDIRGNDELLEMIASQKNEESP